MVGVINLTDALFEKGHITSEQKSVINEYTELQHILDGGFVIHDIIIETLSELLDIKILEAYLQKITILHFSKVAEYSSEGYFICKNHLGEKCFVISNPLLLYKLDINDLKKEYKIMLIKKQDFYDLLDEAFSKLNTQKALLELGFINDRATARNVRYPSSVASVIAVVGFIAYISNTLFVAVNYAIYLTQTLFKMWLFVDASFSSKKQEEISILKDRKHYPIYSVLVPMYKEEHGVKAILQALERLDYPKNRLDIKLVVEADDDLSLRILSTINLPSHIYVIKVPYSEPRTKPKALNYAMQYITGEYVVIYDVEDRPDEDQLLKALYAFENSPENVICIQAKLNFYNSHHNLLTRFFSIEYSIWFKYILPGLDSGSMPIPLGGNSNHFRVASVRKLGLWDAYNVTEDADLGIRLFTNGCQTKVIDSYTLEEAPIDMRNWMHQRARWIKGFVQTFLVYFRQKPELKSRMSIQSQIGIFLLLGFPAYSCFILPWHILVIYSHFTLENKFLAEISMSLTLICMYFTVSIIIARDIREGSKPLDWIALLLWPCYFLLHIAASYKALGELLTKPFSWNKTKHALSKEV